MGHNLDGDKARLTKQNTGFVQVCCTSNQLCNFFFFEYVYQNDTFPFVLWCGILVILLDLKNVLVQRANVENSRIEI